MTTHNESVTFAEIMTPAQVAAIYKVNPKTVTRWAIAGKIPSIKTPGGHRRFFRSDIEKNINSITVTDSAEDPPAQPT